jgi:hypothetical protein
MSGTPLQQLVGSTRNKPIPAPIAYRVVEGAGKIVTQGGPYEQSHEWFSAGEPSGYTCGAAACGAPPADTRLVYYESDVGANHSTDEREVYCTKCQQYTFRRWVEH